jgi:hypothetical protein
LTSSSKLSDKYVKGISFKATFSDVLLEDDMVSADITATAIPKNIIAVKEKTILKESDIILLPITKNA